LLLGDRLWLLVAFAGDVTHHAAVKAFSLLILGTIFRYVAWLVAFVTHVLFLVSVEARLGTISRNVTRLATIITAPIVIGLHSIVHICAAIRTVSSQMT